MKRNTWRGNNKDVWKPPSPSLQKSLKLQCGTKSAKMLSTKIRLQLYNLIEPDSSLD